MSEKLDTKFLLKNLGLEGNVADYVRSQLLDGGMTNHPVTELVYIASETKSQYATSEYLPEPFVVNKESNLVVCYRTANPRKGQRGEPQELTFLHKEPMTNVLAFLRNRI